MAHRHDATSDDIIDVPRITLNWSPWYLWEQVALSVRDGGVSVPFAAGVYEARYVDQDERLTIGKASRLRMRVKQGLVRGKLQHPAGIRIRQREDTTRIVVRWAVVDRRAAVEEELHHRHRAQFGRLPRYTFFT